MKKSLHELKWFAVQARKAGIHVSGGENGNGWINIARACGAEIDCATKESSKRFLRQKFGVMPKATKRRHVPIKADYDRVAKQMRNKHAATHVEGFHVSSTEFLSTYEWRRVRMMALKKYGPICQCCGATPANGSVMNVDHIKPRKLFPHLALDVDNLQILCHECNHGKGNWDMTDWRTSPDDHETDLDREAAQHLRSI